MKLGAILQSIFFVLFLLSSQVQAATYQLDDGTGDDNIGLSPLGAQWTWMNQFDAGAGDTITSIGIAWGQYADGYSARLQIWEDPNDDANPVDRVLLNYIDISISGGGSEGTNDFFFYIISGTFVTGSFFVGVEMDDGWTYPARIDMSSSAGRSWLESADAGVQLGLVDSYNYAGNWMIRANSGEPSPVPEPSTILLLCSGLLGLLAARRSRRS